MTIQALGYCMLTATLTSERKMFQAILSVVHSSSGLGHGLIHFHNRVKGELPNITDKSKESRLKGN